MKFGCRQSFFNYSGLVLTGLLAYTAPVRAGQYSFADLGTLGGTSSYAYGINDNGYVVGVSTNSSGYERAFLYDGASMRDLGTLGGFTSGARDINNLNQIVGYSSTGANQTRAFLYSGLSMIDLGTLGGANSEAYGINDQGVIVGSADTTTSTYSHAFIYYGSMSELSGLPISGNAIGSQATAINDNGQVVGHSLETVLTNGHPSEVTYAFLYNHGAVTKLAFQDSFANNDFAYDINANGQVVGVATLDTLGTRNAFSFDGSGSPGSTMINLGTFGGGTFNSATALNDHGMIVGIAEIFGVDGQVPFLIDEQGIGHLLLEMVDPGHGWSNVFVTDINNNGSIAGYGTRNGSTHAFVLTPVVVPLPAAIWLFASGVAAIAWSTRRRGCSRDVQGAGGD